MLQDSQEQTMGWCPMNVYSSSSAPLGSCSKASSSTRSLLLPCTATELCENDHPRNVCFHVLLCSAENLLEAGRV